MTDAIDRALGVASKYGRLPASYDFYEPPGVKGYTTADINQSIANRTRFAPAMEALLDGMNIGLNNAHLPGYIAAGAVAPVAKMVGGLPMDPAESAGLIAGLGSFARPTGVRPRLPAPQPEPPAGPWTWNDKQFRSAMGDLWDYRARPYTWQEPVPIGANVDDGAMMALRYGRAREGRDDLLSRGGLRDQRISHYNGWDKPNPEDVETALNQRLSRWDKDSSIGLSKYYQTRIAEAEAAGDKKALAAIREEMLKISGPDLRMRENAKALSGMNDRVRAERASKQAASDDHIQKLIDEDDAMNTPAHNRAGLAQRFGSKYNVDKMSDEQINAAWGQETDEISKRLEKLHERLNDLEKSTRKKGAKPPRPFSPDDMGIEPVVQGTLMYGALKGADWKPAERPFSLEDIMNFIGRRPGVTP